MHIAYLNDRQKSHFPVKMFKSTADTTGVQNGLYHAQRTANETHSLEETAKGGRSFLLEIYIQHR